MEKIPDYPEFEELVRSIYADLEAGNQRWTITLWELFFQMQVKHAYDQWRDK